MGSKPFHCLAGAVLLKIFGVVRHGMQIAVIFTAIDVSTDLPRE